MGTYRDRSHRLARSRFRALLLVALGCGGDHDDENPADAASRPTLLAATVQAMGGEDAITIARHQVIEATGQRFDPGEAASAGETILTSDFSATLTAELAAPRLRLDLTNTTRYVAAPTRLEYSQIIDGQNGYVDRGDAIFSPPPPVEPAALASSRITAQLEQADLASPLRLIRRALAEPAAVTEQVDETYAGQSYRVLRIALGGELPVRLFIDSATFLPAKAEMLEDHPPIGDSLVEAVYGDYRAVDGIMVPFALTMRVDGLEILAEERSAIALDGAPEVDYAVPADLIIPFDDDLGERGRRSAQLLIGFEYLGLAELYFGEAEVTIAEIAPGIHLVGGLIYQQLVVEMSDHLILMDAPLDEARSEAVLAELERAFPAKPIQHVIASHFHYDHVGGIRRFAALGGVTVWAGAESEEFFRRVIDNPHTVAPDHLQENPVAVRVEGVDLLSELTDGVRTVQLHKIATSHADDMLVAYLPGERVLFVADIYNPGLPIVLFADGARELLDEVTRLGLDVERIAGAHAMGTATMDDLRTVAGRGRQPGRAGEP